MADINLLGLLPAYFKVVRDFQALMETEEIELSEFEGYVNKVYDNLFIQTADENTIAYHEKLLGIIVQAGETLEFRRARVLNRYNSVLPYTIVTLREKLDLLIGPGNYELRIDYGTYNLYVKIVAGEFGIMDEMTNMLVYMIPAHMAYSIAQELNARGVSNTYVAGAISPTMRYFLTQDFHIDYSIRSPSYVAATYNPTSRYRLSQDINVDYAEAVTAKTRSAINPTYKYRLS